MRSPGSAASAVNNPEVRSVEDKRSGRVEAERAA